MKNKILTIMFLSFIAFFCIAYIIVPDKFLSENENKYLTQFPEFSFDSLFSGRYISSVEDYVTDQFPYRGQYINLKTSCDKLIGKLDINGVYLAEDGYFIEKFEEVDFDTFNSNVSAIENFAVDVSKIIDKPVDVILIPTSSYILSAKLPSNIPEIDQNELINFSDSEYINVINICGKFLENSEKYLYYKTDHHFTSLGGFYAYDVYCENKFNSNADKNDYEVELLSSEFLGTLYSKVSEVGTKPDEMYSYTTDNIEKVEYNYAQITSDSILNKEHLEKKDKYQVYLNGNQPQTKITTSNDNDKRLLIIKDSYANTFAQFPVIDYEEVHMIDLRYFKKSTLTYIEENNITDVLVLYGVKNFCEDVNITSIK